MKLEEMSSSVRRESLRNEASSGKDLARALAKLSPGGMTEFVQFVPLNVAGSQHKERGGSSHRVLRVALPGP